VTVGFLFDVLQVQEALTHPYLGSLHDESVEPAAEHIFEFDFEDDQKLKEDELRDRVYEELVIYHPDLKDK